MTLLNIKCILGEFGAAGKSWTRDDLKVMFLRSWRKMLLVGVVWLAMIVVINTYVGIEYGGSGDSSESYKGFNRVHSVQKAIERMRSRVLGENRTTEAETEFRREYVKGVSCPDLVTL